MSAENLNFRPADSGPIYAETLRAHGWPVEPWNTASNLVFLAILVYWFAKMRRPEDRHPFITGCLPVLAIGFVGGTLYHGTRSHDLWYVMDYGPIMALVLATAVFFWKRLFSWRTALLAAGGIEVFAIYARESTGFSTMTRISIGYALMAVQILLPVLLFARSRKWRHSKWLALSFSSIAAAIALRQADQSLANVLPQGTHFLWHLLGGLSVQSLIQFIYLSDRERMGLGADRDKTRESAA